MSASKFPDCGRPPKKVDFADCDHDDAETRGSCGRSAGIRAMVEARSACREAALRIPIPGLLQRSPTIAGFRRIASAGPLLVARCDSDGVELRPVLDITRRLCRAWARRSLGRAVSSQAGDRPDRVSGRRPADGAAHAALGTDNGSALTARAVKILLAGLGDRATALPLRRRREQAFLESWFGLLKERCAWRLESSSTRSCRHGA